MEQSVQTLKNWLESQSGHTVKIEKKELNDLDTVHFKLNAVEYRDADDVLDNYLDSALILRGSGSTLNQDGELVPLPQQSYEIALHGLRIGGMDGNYTELHTDRGNYALSVEEDQ